MDGPSISTIVCAGPTISEREILTILPQAAVHAPVQCGDFIKLLRLRPQRIIIIDGYYEHTASVWHKEILLALHSGVGVIGAASMGALRAAELDEFGMIGVGQIYQWYRDNTLVNDDEVAILHLDAAYGYAAKSEALVNIRASLDLAKKTGIISAEIENKLLELAMAQFYPQRSYRSLVQEGEKELGSLSFLADWLQKNAVDLKHRDALAALHWAKTQEIQPPAPFLLQDSIYLKRLTLLNNARPFALAYAWLPGSEQSLLCQFNNLKKPWVYQQLATMLNLVYCLAEQGSPAHTVANKLQVIETWLLQKQLELHLEEETLTRYQFLLSQLIWSEQELSAASAHWFSLCFLVLDGLLTEKKINCQPKHCRAYRRWLVSDLGLENELALEHWLAAKKIAKDEFEQLVQQCARFRFAYSYFLGLFVEPIPTIPVDNWLHIALTI